MWQFRYGDLRILHCVPLCDIRDPSWRMETESTPTAVWASPSLTFRGRIFRPEYGYTPRTLLELRIRAGIGAILNKREWWVKWRRDDGAIRDKWLTEFERSFIEETFVWSTHEWSVWGLDQAVLSRFDKFPTDGTDEQKRAFIDEVCSTIPYNLIWNEEWWEDYGNEELEDGSEGEDRFSETPEQFNERNEKMNPYGQITWYYDLVLLNREVREIPFDQWEAPHEFELGTEPAVDMATNLVLAVHRGEVTRDNFATFAPDGDLRTEIVNALWFHIDRIMSELIEIRQCIIKTIEKVIENNRLDAELITEFVSPGPLQETWMSDIMVKDSLKKKFQKEVGALENVPDAEKDWHPESNNQVLDLLHPSLYCCVFGTTKGVTSVSSDDTRDEDIVKQMQRLTFSASHVVENKYRGTAGYQWIPSDFQVDKHGNVQILSYINNLHPVKYRAMYDSIALIFKEFVPMLDRVLSCLLNQDGPLPTMDYFDTYQRETHEVPVHPPIPEILRLHPPGTPFTLRGKKVQVIVKIAEIVLTPESPSYPGGSWHVEGSDAEQIVATGIYYFGCENITESRLSFRVIVREPDYQQDDTLGMAAAYGLIRDERLVQSLGSITAMEDRCIVFPNTLQHRVEPFELADQTKPGVRKILAFFVVDPSKQIPSTAVIPPQQADWIRQRQEPILDQLQSVWSLPEGVIDKTVKELLGTGMTLEEAKAHRLELMEERKPAPEEDEDYELFFSLCEH